MLIALLTISAALILLLYLGPTSHRRHMYRCAEKIPGSKPLPIVGNVFEFGLNFDNYIPALMRYYYKYGKIIKAWMGPILIVNVAEPADVEILLTSKRHLEKSFVYKFLEPWLGTGLLTSAGEKWHSRRRLLTPTFHFRVLEQYVDVFNDQGDVLIKELQERGEAAFDVCPYVDTYAYRVICDTAMGEKKKREIHEKDEGYLNAISTMGELFIERIQRPWYYSKFLFNLSPTARKQEKCLDLLHSNTRKVIAERKEMLKSVPPNNEESTTNVYGAKRRHDFLDHLLLASQEENSLTDEGIREEVDTFMFEGHDTVSSAISFALYELARNQDIQQEVFDEVRSMANGAEEPRFTMDQLNELKYTEMVIKEALRLYPSVMWFARYITEDITLTNDIVLPAGCHVQISPYGVHRSEGSFPDPEKFDPQRFTPEAIRSRHPFAYIPFSAGYRNCIGQKFAMLEMKSVLSKLVWNFKILPEENFTPHVVIRFTLKSKNGIKIRLQKRLIV